MRNCQKKLPALYHNNMSDLAAVVTKILAVLTVLSQVFIVFAWLALLMKEKSFLRFFKGKEFFFAFCIAFGAMISSLFYSYYANFAACDLCWYQRIFFYPIVFILGLAMYKKDQKIGDYILLLCFIGSIIAIYHSYIQLGGAALIPCSYGGESCSKRYIWEFGYISMPIMSLTGFWSIMALMKIHKFNQK